MNVACVIISAIFTLSLLSIQNLAYAEIKVTPPRGWEPIPANNIQALMAWHQSSSNSSFGIIKFPDDGSSSTISAASPLAMTGPIMAEAYNMTGMLESTDQISFGHGNFGFRYFLNMRSPSELLNSSVAAFAQPSSIAKLQDLVEKGCADIHIKGMQILTENQDGLYLIMLVSPRENFDSVMKEIQPTIDSIEFS